ncbi:MAG: phenylacetate--CoA ligase family protein [Oscillospiraceae bacterium]|nr:phenylacetate--CoA ligase family protein [Oscillospiraceae bacterium]
MTSFDRFDTEKALASLRAQLRLLGERGRFRPEVYASAELPSLDALAELPFTSSVDIIQHGRDMLCVSPREVARVVTLSSSGTSGAAKRLCFTRGDLERTAAFFAEGMGVICREGERCAIVMPDSSDMGLTSLLTEGLRRIDVEAGVFPPGDYAQTAARLREFKPDVMVGAPVYLRRLALESVDITPRAVLVSSDYCADSAVATIGRVWGAEVYTHYGLTETGLGCAVQCRERGGMHIRCDELYIEIVDPETGAPLPDGTPGEIVISTLRREAMPLVRYRTGDIGIKGRCACGAPSLTKVLGRADELRRSPSLYELDEQLLACDGVLDFTAARTPEGLVLTVDGDAEAAAALFPEAKVLRGSAAPPSGREKRRVAQY